MSNDVPLRVKAQRLGGKPSAMVLPNLGAFMSWSILTTLGIWLSNDVLKAFISPVLTYLLPLLIATSREEMVYGEKGTIIGVFTTMGTIIGAGISILLGTMIITLLPAQLSKKPDAVMEPLIPADFGLLIGNLAIALLDAAITIIGCIWIAPVITPLSAVFSAGVSTLENSNLLLLTTILIKSVKVLFLNNTIGQGTLTLLGTTQPNRFGKSVLFLLGSNPRLEFGVLLTYYLFGKGNAKASAYGASITHFFDGIHEVYLPFILMNPLAVLAATAEGITGTFLFTLPSVGPVGTSSSGSIVTIMMMVSAGDQLLVLLAILTSAVIDFLTAAVIVRHLEQSDEGVNKNLKEATEQMESLKGEKSRTSLVFGEKKAVTDFHTIEYIIYVCDAGVGSSVMGASMIAKRLRKVGITDIAVERTRVTELPDPRANIIVTHVFLQQVVYEKQPDIEIISIEDCLNAPGYDELVSGIKTTRSQC